MKTGFLVAAGLAALCITAPVLAASASGNANGNGNSQTLYPRDLLKNKPELARQYSNLVKPVAADHDWIGQGGTQTPVTRISFGGTDYAVLSSCKPHDCASQTLVVLLPGGKTHPDDAVGALVENQGDTGLGPRRSAITWLGDPERDQRRFLGAYLFR